MFISTVEIIYHIRTEKWHIEKSAAKTQKADDRKEMPNRLIIYFLVNTTIL